MNAKDYIDEVFRSPGELSPGKRIYYVQSSIDSRIYVKKILSQYSRPVYDELLKRPVEGIPRIYALDEDAAGGELTVIEEYIPGQTLNMLEMPLSENETAAAALGLCRTIARLHSLNPPVIHRDIKPSNIISFGGRWYLTDMNIARTFRSGRSEDTELMGTNGFAAPEQYGFGQSDIRTDIYGFGATLKKLLSDPRTGALVCSAPMKKIIARCTMIDPEQRYQDTRQLIEAMQDLPCLRHSAGNTPLNQADGKPLAGRRRYLPPGFRSGKILYMIPAAAGYVFLAVCCFWAGSSQSFSAGSRIIIRVMMYAAAVLCVLIDGDYLGITRRLPFLHTEDTLLRILAKCICNILTVILFLCAAALIVGFIHA